MKLLDSPMGVGPRRRRPWLRWLALAVFVVALGSAFVNLGRWQLDRLEQRRERNNSVVAHENSPEVEFSSVFTSTIVEADQWQRVRVAGTFDAEHQFLVRYRVNGADSGFEIVTPFQTLTGQWVLVDRGFAVKSGAQDYPRVLPAPPAGQVSVLGYVRRNEQGSQDAMTPVAASADGPANTIRLVNSDALSAGLPYPLVNGFLSVIEMAPPQEGGLISVQPPSLDEGNHFSYAIQWFMFAGMAGVGLVLLIRSDVRALRGSVPAPAPASEHGEVQ